MKVSKSNPGTGFLVSVDTGAKACMAQTVTGTGTPPVVVQCGASGGTAAVTFAASYSGDGVFTVCFW